MSKDRAEFMEYLSHNDPKWTEAFNMLETRTGITLRSPCVYDLAEFSRDDEGDVSFLWNFDETKILVQLDIWFKKDGTPMVDWFWASQMSAYAFDGTEEDSIPLAELPEQVIDFLKDKSLQLQLEMEVV